MVASRPFTIVGAVIAVLALGAFILFGGKGGGAVPTAGTGIQASIVVAAHDLPLRVALTPTDVTVVKMPSTSVPPHHFDKVEQVKNLIPIATILKDQALTSNLLVSSPDEVSGAQAAFLPIPKGFVGTTIPTGEQQGVAGNIQAGDYISIVVVMVTQTGRFSNVRTVFTNIHVLRVGPANLDVQAAQNKGSVPAKQTSGAASLTVVVTQCQAEFINWFIANGTIKYTLESYKDYAPRDTTADVNCPNADAAKGVTAGDVSRTWPGLIN